MGAGILAIMSHEDIGITIGGAAVLQISVDGDFLPERRPSPNWRSIWSSLRKRSREWRSTSLN